MIISNYLSEIRRWSKVAPLIAAIIAPLSTLLDIPALVEKWFYDEAGNPIADPSASRSLSAAGLAFSVIANLLLLVRYSSTTSEVIWEWATRFSIVFWWTKVALALVNVCVFGKPRPDTFRSEGFWCAVASLVLCGIICVLLSLHWAFWVTDNEAEAMHRAHIDVRISGRHFMLAVTFFVVDVALFALVTSRIERWTFFQGIYFSIITYTTIGFGDFHPTKTATRILLCPFAVIGVAQLANIVSMNASYFSKRAADRRAENRNEFEARRQEELEAMDRAAFEGVPGGSMTHKPDLAKEFEYLDKLRHSEDKMNKIREVAFSFGGLMVFWVVGAAIFSELEDWKYGVSLYFCFVVLLTLGYGEFAPITPGGRVVFIIYALIAVPVIAAFAVQTVVHIFTTISERRLTRQQVKQAKHEANRGAEHSHHHQNAEEKGALHVLHVARRGKHRRHHKKSSTFAPHSDLVARFHREWDEAEAAEDEDIRLTERVIGLALAMERRSRKLLIAHLENGTTAKMLLQADSNVQLREVRTMQRRRAVGEEAGFAGNRNNYAGESGATRRWAVEEDQMAVSTVMSEVETLTEVEQYREGFAGLLAAGSRLMKLKGEEKALFEKRWDVLGAEGE